MLIRESTLEDMAAVGALRVSAYAAGGHISPDSGYAETLRALGSDGVGRVLVAVAPSAPGEPADHRGQTPASGIVGTVMLQPWPEAGQVVVSPDEAEIRALAVAPAAQGQGVGDALLHAAIDLAAQSCVRHLVLCTQPDMRSAHRLYQRAGFVRLPERDWSPVPDQTLLVFGLRLHAAAPAS